MNNNSRATESMSHLLRNFLVVFGLGAIMAVGAALVSSPIALVGLATLLALAAVILLRGNGWRASALFVAAIGAAIGVLDLFTWTLGFVPHSTGLVQRFEPPEWIQSAPDLGYTLKPDTNVVATATFEGREIYHATYTVDSDSMRVTPAALPGALTYLFLGDSFIFGQGLSDDQTLAAQFARLCHFKVRTAIFAAPGYGPNHLVRALETGKLKSIEALTMGVVVTWIIPAQLARVSGEEPWLGASPRYEIVNGAASYTGSFEQYRRSNPLIGLRYVANSNFDFIRAIGLAQRQELQGELFISLMLRLRALVRERLHAPLLVIYSWPDETSQAAYSNSEVDQPMLVSLLERMRQHGVRLLSVNQLVANRDAAQLLFPHDGHPTALTNHLVAAALKRRFCPD